MKRMTLVLAAALIALTGCTGSKPYDLVDVEGQVLLDGQPLADALVTFRPMADPSQKEVGPDAYGRTDAQGNFTLNTVFDEDGATVGRNLVSITTLSVQENPSDPDNARARQVVIPERVPPQYNQKSDLFYDVREGGAQTATFNLQSR